jgi:hypothetical protein
MFALSSKANIAQQKKNDRKGHSSFCSFLITYPCLSGRSRGEHRSGGRHSHGEHRLTKVNSNVDSIQ